MRAFWCFVRVGEQYMVHDELWRQAGDVAGYLCIGCLETRLGRRLAPEDFPELPLNDDCPNDSARLAARKGTGRDSETRYRLGVDLVLDSGRDAVEVARALKISARGLAIWIENARLYDETVALVEASCPR